METVAVAIVTLLIIILGGVFLNFSIKHDEKKEAAKAKAEVKTAGKAAQGKAA